MPCDQHTHNWPTIGKLVVNQCERKCAYCKEDRPDHKYGRVWSSADALRKHVMAFHLSEYPELQLWFNKIWTSASTLAEDCVGHNHAQLWQRPGPLVIEPCEHYCQFCIQENGPDAPRHRYARGETLRAHVRRMHFDDTTTSMSGDTDHTTTNQEGLDKTSQSRKSATSGNDNWNLMTDSRVSNAFTTDEVQGRKLTTGQYESDQVTTHHRQRRSLTTEGGQDQDMSTIENQVKADFARASVEQFLLTCRNSGILDADVQEMIGDAMQEFFVNIPGAESNACTPD